MTNNTTYLGAVRTRRISELEDGTPIQTTDLVPVTRGTSSVRVNLGSMASENKENYLSTNTYNFYTPEMFGASSSENQDCTTILNNLFAAALADGKGVDLSKRYYRTGGLNLYGQSRGLLVRGNSGLVAKKQFINNCGLKPVSTGQDYVLKLGIESDGADFEQFHWVGADINGDHMTTKKGLLWLYQASQCQFDDFSLTRNRGTLLFMHKAEDVFFNNYRMMYGGSVSPDSGYAGGSVVFGKAPNPADDIGSNAVWFMNGRHEFIDGGIVMTDNSTETTTYEPHANSVFFQNCKFETFSGYGDYPSSSENYGTSSASHPMFNFKRGNTNNRIGVEINNCFFSHAENCDSLFAVGDSERFIVRGCTASGTDASFRLFRLVNNDGSQANCKQFVLEPLVTRNYSTSNTSRAYTWENKNKYPIWFWLPYDGKSPMDNALTTNDAWRHAGAFSWIPSTGYQIEPEPDSVGNPCGSWHGVCGVVRGSSTSPILTRLNYATDTPSRVGLLGNEDHVREFKFWACKTGHASNFVVALYDGSGEIPNTAITITSNTFAEYTVYYSALGLTGDIRLKPKAGNNSAHIMYWSKYLDRGVSVAKGSAAPTTGTWAVGDTVLNIAPATGQPAGWACSVAGTPGTWKAMANFV